MTTAPKVQRVSWESLSQGRSRENRSQSQKPHQNKALLQKNPTKSGIIPVFYYVRCHCRRSDQCCSTTLVETVTGYFSRSRFKCSFTVVKTLLYCTRKWSCNLSCTSALSMLQLPCNGSTGQVPLPEHEISQGLPRTCTKCSSRMFHVPGGGFGVFARCASVPIYKYKYIGTYI